jgi:hypothetical protein
MNIIGNFRPFLVFTNHKPLNCIILALEIEWKWMTEYLTNGQIYLERETDEHKIDQNFIKL